MLLLKKAVDDVIDDFECYKFMVYLDGVYSWEFFVLNFIKIEIVCEWECEFQNLIFPVGFGKKPNPNKPLILSNQLCCFFRKKVKMILYHLNDRTPTFKGVNWDCMLS